MCKHEIYYIISPDQVVGEMDVADEDFYHKTVKNRNSRGTKFVIGVFIVGGSAIGFTLFEKNVNFDDKIDDTNIVKTTNDTSLVRCAASCDNEPNCVAFYINPTTKTCQEQSALSNTEMIGLTSSPGFRYYQNCLPQVVALPEGAFECPVNNGAWSAGHLPDGTYMFKLFTDTDVDYVTAFNMCKGIGANLPKIYTAEKLTFYRSNIFSCPGIHGHGFWVDGTNINAPVQTSEDAWTTHDGIVIPKIPELWYLDRPNNPTTENCIHSRHNSFNYLFDDANCGWQLYKVLCEKKISC
ncbi:hypothetical protein ACF0H5_022323 [Mactra antiquata]